MGTSFMFIYRFFLFPIIFVVFRLFSFPPLNILPLGLIYFVPLLFRYKNPKSTVWEPVIHSLIIAILIQVQFYINPILDPYQGNAIYYFSMAYFFVYYLVIFLSAWGINKKFPKYTFLLIPLLVFLFESLFNILPVFPVFYPSLSLAGSLSIISKIRFTGIIGLDVLLILLNESIAKALYSFISLKRFQAVSALLVSFLILIFFFFPVGSFQKDKISDTTETYNIGYIQGAIPSWKYSYTRYSKGLQDTIAKEYFTALDTFQNVDCVVFPENAIIGKAEEVDKHIKRVQEWALLNSTAVLINAEYKDQDDDIYNSALFINNRGEIAQKYDKINLVLFDESSYFQKGNDVSLIDVKGAKGSILICFDVIFEDIYKKAIKKGAKFIISINNDNFAGISFIPYLHFTYARLYAIQEQIPIIHVTQSGCSGLILPDGRVQGYTPAFKKETAIVELPIKL